MKYIIKKPLKKNINNKDKILFFILFFLFACGQKGPLYLVKKEDNLSKVSLQPQVKKYYFDQNKVPVVYRDLPNLVGYDFIIENNAKSWKNKIKSIESYPAYIALSQKESHDDILTFNAFYGFFNNPIKNNAKKEYILNKSYYRLYTMSGNRASDIANFIISARQDSKKFSSLNNPIILLVISESQIQLYIETSENS